MFFKKKNNFNVINKIYTKITNISRSKRIYQKLGVPDTFDGRFDILILFTIIVVYHLSKLNSQGKILAQNLFDHLFQDLDYTLREMGLGDAGVSIKIKKLASAYMGRQKAYCESFENKNLNKLFNNIDNNVFRNIEVKKSNINDLCNYCFIVLDNFENFDNKKFLIGEFNFPIFKIK